MNDTRTYAASSEGEYPFNVQTGVCTDWSGTTNALKYIDRYIVGFDVDLYKEMFGHGFEEFDDSVDICHLAWHTSDDTGVVGFELVDRDTMDDLVGWLQECGEGDTPWVLHLEKWLNDNPKHPKVSD